jgi:hypothetical protein
MMSIHELTGSGGKTVKFSVALLLPPNDLEYDICVAENRI